ncbi:C6 zinc finger domain-containing protein [Trematosphaeria pertusa]|uniref:C6 zinc finger domain-containing protein n=1 Tax=Trematosphaeria pertusa TaxID=390896 RepID=A0A6A6HVB9_9PLEO|nr:C6 zinc finger domain-containing protein [Trematosphaeria pertusa]KAF2241829.1 C6 zinc finger domain-containing protein [Trematosphaeria pertusa]
MPPLVQAKAASKDLKAKKTKSRNGCGRCKLKRLKCDETTPSCLQCKKRNVPCPGYEKTLKWSTKYEVFQPTVQFGSSPTNASPKPDVISKTPQVTEVTLPPDVERGFEALAAVLPTSKKPAEPARENASRQPTPPAAAIDTPPVLLQTSSSPETFGSESSPPEPEPLPEPFFLQDLNAFDPLLLDGLINAIGDQNGDFTFDALEGFDIDPGPLDDIGLDLDQVQFPEDEEEEEEDAAGTTLVSPRLSRSLLLDFYRLPNPSPSVKTVDDVESILIQHYFKDVCALFSAFDSVLNPFRTTIGRIFQDTPSVYYAIQSMAAAHLANTFPNMSAVGMELQRKAVDSLQEELPLVQSGQASCTKTFLSIILLGLSTCWHESSALGEEFLTTARSLILPKLLSSSEEEEVQRETQFFEESLIYWEMLMGFVTQDSMTFAPSGLRSRGASKAIPAARKKDGKIVPHPWTGIAPTIQILFAEVGRLVRRERMLDMNPTVDFRRRQENLLNAATLEEDLLAAEYPLAEELADIGDERTPKHDFVVIAEAYRCAGLLELYRVFPSILRKRLGTDNFTWTDSLDLEFPTPRFETPYEDTDTKLWINSLAMHILQAIESLPSSSGTICIQPILLVTAASELKFVSSVDYFDIYANDARVLQAREFAVRRMQEYSMRLPAKPLRQMIELVKEVWRRQDNGQNAFWIDVMNEMGWHTVMG